MCGTDPFSCLDNLWGKPSCDKLVEGDATGVFMHKPLNSPFEQMIWNRLRFPRKKFFGLMRAAQIPTSLRQKAHLLTIGDRGAVIIPSVSHNGDFYKRTGKTRKKVYGSAAILSRFNLECRFLDEAQLILRAIQPRPRVYRIRRVSDNILFDVVLLHVWPDLRSSQKYTCGVFFDAAQAARPLNIEPKAPYNLRANQFERVAEISDNKLVRMLRSRLSELGKYQP
jgi:hypothetical protein